MMRDYTSTMYATANENGVEEIELEYNRDWPEMLWTYLKTLERQEMSVVETYVLDGICWVNKDTGVPVSNDMLFVLSEVKGRLKRQAMIENTFFGEQ